MGQACSVETMKEKGQAIKARVGGGGTFKVASLNRMKRFDLEYQSGRQLSPKVVEVKNKITQRIDVVYKLPKINCPCTKGDEISKVLKCIQGLEHPNVCRFMEGFDDPKFIFLVYQHVRGSTLMKSMMKCKQPSEKRAAEVGWQLVRALIAGEACNPPLMHGALAPKNVLVNNNGTIVVTDLGLIDLVKPDPIQRIQQDAVAFMAPEMVSAWIGRQEKHDKTCKDIVELGVGDRGDMKKTVACDVWSLGVIIYQLLVGKPPFQGKTVLELAKRIVKCDPEIFGKLDKASEPARNILQSMLNKNPALRPSLQTLLADPWIAAAHKAQAGDEEVDIEVIKNLTTIHNETHFKKFMMQMIAEKVSPNKIRQLEQTFMKADQNGDGILTFTELKDFLEAHPEIEVDRDQLNAAYKEIDADCNGHISIHEFVAATLDTQGILVYNVLWDAFKAIDANHDGKLSRQELKRVINEMHNRLGKDHITRMTQMVQTEVPKEGMDFEEFCAILQEEGCRAERSGWSCTQVTQACTLPRRLCSAQEGE